MDVQSCVMDGQVPHKCLSSILWCTPKEFFFFKSIDASNMIKDHAYIYDLLKKIIAEVVKTNVVQIVIDNGFAFVEAGKKLMEHYHLYWNPCAAYCIDLMFEDIEKK